MTGTYLEQNLAKGGMDCLMDINSSYHTVKREGEQPAGPRQHLIRGGNMASAPSLLLSADGLSPHGEKQLLSTFSFCFFNSALMKKVLEKASDLPDCFGCPPLAQPAVAGIGTESWKKMAAT